MNNKNIENKYRAFPFWSWNDELDKNELIKQIDWMHDSGIGGFFMHARGGLTTPYLGESWFECIEACLKRAKELDMEAYAYDENGWPSGFVGGKLLDEPDNHDMFISKTIGEYDSNALVSYDISKDKLVRVKEGKNVLNIYVKNSVSTADILNKDVVDKFIALTHEQYKKHDIYGNLRGFFTDEPQYYRWDMPYTRVLPKYYKETYGRDLLDELGLLFVEKDGYRTFRYRYWKSLQELMINNFGKNIYEWCEKNGYKLTGHYIEETSLSKQMWCCAGIMPFYEWEHIPGIDVLGRNLLRSASPKQLGSVAEQLGKEQRMAEIFACTGWDATPNELKLLAEYVMVGGVNILCPHLLPYSEHGQRKRDHPEHFSKINPWVKKDFKAFNDYFSDVGKKLAQSREIANVGVFHPIRSAYFEYKTRDPENKTAYLDDAFFADNLLLEQNHIPFHYIDETILARHGFVNGNKLCVGKCSYDFLIIPTKMLTMDITTEKILHQYILNGGKVLLLGDKPKYLEGEEFNYNYLESNTTLDEIINSLDVKVSKNDTVVCSFHIDQDGNTFVYALNTGDKTEVEITSKNFKNLKIGKAVVSSKVNFDKYESKFIYLTNEEITNVENKNVIHLENGFNLDSAVDNYIKLDKISYSKDGLNYEKPLHCMCLFEKMLKEQYRGPLYLKYSVDIKKVPTQCEALVENNRILSVVVNGKAVHKSGSILEKDLFKYDLNGSLKTGINEIIVLIDMFEDDGVYYALFGENVTESLRNCLVYNTTIEAIYLKGNFGVFGDFKEDGEGFIASTFYLDEQKNQIVDIVRDGYPFFRGEMKISQTIIISDPNSILELNERFQMIDVYVNNEFVERMIFKNKVDLSNYLTKGNNKITLDVVVSNRNLLGPHHSPEIDPKGVGPYSFERFGSWSDEGTSVIYKDRYAFVKVI